MFQTEEYCRICRSESESRQQPIVTDEAGLNQHQPGKFEFLKDSLILDTGSTISATIMNEDMMTDIKKSKVPIIMTTNA